ncbi:MAG: ABC transporter ATP-binding protein, partial [Chloroflexi bacterium]
MASVTYEHVYKRYPGNTVITDMNAQIKDKEFVVLVGPSGSGKSTALRMLAGLEEISDGMVRIGDRVVNDVAPKDRDIAMVFQSYALYPHMSVYDNLSFGLKLRKTQTRVQILKLHQRLQTTFIYVTHDQVEAMTMGERIVVLDNGIVQQFDSPQTLYEHPVNLFVAGFIGSPAMNFLNVKVGGDGQTQLQGEGFQVPVEERVLSEAGAERGQDVIMGIRPEDLKDVRFPGREGLPKVSAKVEVVESMGSEIFVYIVLGGKTLTARMDPR